MFRTILVTGGWGVAGLALQRIAKTDHPETAFLFPRSSELNLTKWDLVERYMEQHRPDAIIHLAAVSGGIGLSLKHQGSMLRDNVLMALNVLEATRLFSVRKTVMALTTGAYPPNAPLPLREETLHDGQPHPSNYGSSFAKRLVDPAIRGYREEYGVSAVGLVPNGIFGEDDTFNFDDAPMLLALIRRFYENRNTSDPIVIWGDGTPLREYTYAPDVARAFLWATHHYDDGQVLNSGTTEEYTIRDIALMIAEFTGVDPARIVFDTTKPNGVFRKNTDNGRFVGLSGFRYTPFREALRRTVEWFAHTYESDRGRLRLYSKAKA